jgi:hypothetical protein
MIRAAFACMFLSLSTMVAGASSGEALSPKPGWQTDAANCSWIWRKGGGLGLWTEECTFNNAKWRVVWDKGRSAFVIRNGKADMGIAVQPFALPEGADIAALSLRFIASGHLKADAECSWQPLAVRPAPRTITFYVLAPVDPDALAPTAQGEVPDPACGPYGASTHGIRYFILDVRWPNLAIFVEEGQERPLFDPASITMLSRSTASLRF